LGKEIRFFLLFLLLFIFSLASANLESIGTFQQDKTIRISQVCSDATYINISSISYPNSTTAVSNIEMTSAGSGEFYYDFLNTNVLGRYDVRGISDGCEGTFATYFVVTYTGEELSMPQAVMYIVVLFFLVGLLIYLIFIYPKLPQNEVTDDGYVMSVNQLTYLRPVVIGCMWLLLMAITFIVSNIAVAYIQAGFLGNFLFGIWSIMMWSNLLLLPLWIIWIITTAFRQAKLKKFFDRGGMTFQ
jgi:hypothetical protein